MAVDVQAPAWRRSSPASISPPRSRKSLTPDSPSRPDLRFSRASSSSTSRPPARSRCSSAPGSMSPLRVPITRPSSGVRPIEVSTATPPRIADADAPLPRCRTIWFSSPEIPAEHRRHLLRHVLVRRAVKSVPPDLVGSSDFAVDGVGVGGGRQGPEERGVEDRDLGRVRKRMHGLLDADRRWPDCAAEPAPRDPESAAAQRYRSAPDHRTTNLRVPPDARRQSDARRPTAVPNRRTAAASPPELRRGRRSAPTCSVLTPPDSWTALAPSSPIRSTMPVASARPASHVDQLVLHRRRARIDDQHGGHRSAPAGDSWAWIAVMATVLTMSTTNAPRDRSLTGRLSPCSTGPMATAPALRCTAL